MIKPHNLKIIFLKHSEDPNSNAIDWYDIGYRFDMKDKNYGQYIRFLDEPADDQIMDAIKALIEAANESWEALQE